LPKTERVTDASARMTIALFIPCSVDACHPIVGISLVQIPRRLDRQVVSPEAMRP